MNLEQCIFKRQSCREYEDEPLDEQSIDDIRAFIMAAKPLSNDIRWSYDIVTQDYVKTLLPWKAPHYLLLFSEQKDNYKENIGFIFQQLDLYLQSKEIGSCWLGMASPNSKYVNKNNQYEFVIALSFGYPKKSLYRRKEDFNRKRLEEITDNIDERLVPAQYAPSAMNSQPWYFTHGTNGTYNIYRQKLGYIKDKIVGRWSPIDTGIALAHLYVSNRDTFKFIIKEDVPDLKNKYYVGSFEL